MMVVFLLKSKIFNSKLERLFGDLGTNYIRSIMEVALRNSKIPEDRLIAKINNKANNVVLS
jgi:hypothetical protein